MSERDTYPHGVPCWVEALVPDPETATEFYAGIFGWEFDGPGQDARTSPPPSTSSPGCAAVTSPGLARCPTARRARSGPPTSAPTAPTPPPRRLRPRAGRWSRVPFDVPPVGRMAVLADPAGARFVAWEADGREGAQLVNEPSAWSMSALHTPDAAAAEEFYGSVFGWNRESFGGPVSMFRLPGFVGGEPEQPVPRDVVAAMVDVGPDSGAPAGWRPDFWVGGHRRGGGQGRGARRHRDRAARRGAGPADAKRRGRRSVRRDVLSDPAAPP